MQKKIVIIISAVVIGGIVLFLQKEEGTTSPSVVEKIQESKNDLSNKAKEPHRPETSINHDHSDHNEDDSESKSVKAKDSSTTTAHSDSNPFYHQLGEEREFSLKEVKDFAYRPIKFVPKNKDEESVLEMARLMTVSTFVNDGHEEVKRFYNENNLTLDISGSSNPYTGKMEVIRTKASLPGTRYYHSQYFMNEGGEMEQQHFSMEMRGGKGVLSRSREMVEALFEVENPLVTRDGKSVLYRTKSGRNLWLLEMQEEDLQDSPYNAYTKEDIGTVRFTIEDEIHTDGHYHDEGTSGGDGHMQPPSQ